MTDIFKPWVAWSTDGEVEYSHTFYAATETDALAIASRNGWRLDGEIVSEGDDIELIQPQYH